MSKIKEKINFFKDKGYVVFEQIISHDLINKFSQDFENLLLENQPLKVNLFEDTISFQAIKSETEKQNCIKFGRFIDIENYSSLCKELIFYPAISNFLTNLYSGNKPTNLQTLTYKYSSQQGEHSDKYLVSPDWASGYNRNTLTAAWIALEDADESNGALIIYPGSHLISDKKRLIEDFDNNYASYVQYCQNICQQNNLKPEYFYAKKGDVLFWHGDFIHAGGPVNNWAKSRFSLVCHYANIEDNHNPLSLKNCLSYRQRISYHNLGYFYKSKITDPEQIQLLIDSIHNWYHKIELAPGIVTPGIRNCDRALSKLNSLGLPKDCKSLRVLEIGCKDGFFSFEMEARGAKVIAIDDTEEDVTGFSVASKIKDSQVAYFKDNVYELDPQKYGLFDIILFLDVPYNQPKPVYVIDKIQKLIKPDGLLFIETQIKPNLVLQKINLVLQKIPIPTWQIYPETILNQDRIDSLSPNISRLKVAFEAAQFKILDSVIDSDRAYIIAKAEKDSDKEYFQQPDFSRDLLNKEQTKFFGSVDEVTHTSISGWAINPDQLDEPCIIIVWQNNQILAIQLANTERLDLKEAGYGNGKYGFVISLSQLQDNSPISITVTSPQGQAFPHPTSSWLVKKKVVAESGYDFG